MQWTLDPSDEQSMKLQVLAFIEEHCRGLTLRDVRDWYDETLVSEMPSESDLNRP